MKIRELINKWEGQRSGKSITVYEIEYACSPTSNKVKVAQSRPFDARRFSMYGWEFDVDDNEVKRIKNMTVENFYFAEHGLVIIGRKHS